MSPRATFVTTAPLGKCSIVSLLIKLIVSLDAGQQTDKTSEQLHYLRGCKETIEYLMTGKLPDDGNHVGMKHHRPVSVDSKSMESMLKRPIRHGNLDALD